MFEMAGEFLTWVGTLNVEKGGVSKAPAICWILVSVIVFALAGD